MNMYSKANVYQAELYNLLRFIFWKIGLYLEVPNLILKFSIKIQIASDLNKSLSI